jgi:exopolyphosphatase/pppGpp-phosphohydrolase
VLQLAESCSYEAEHAHQVTRLALRLFDELQTLHGFGEEERFWLQCGALLHDIGWIEGQRGHHKASLRIILDTPLLPFSPRQKLIIGSIARYHRKALPSERHEHYTALGPAERDTVRTLAAILRVADGLDRTHRSIVEDVSCEVTAQQIFVQCIVSAPAEPERLEALDKGRLLEQASSRQLVIQWALN